MRKSMECKERKLIKEKLAKNNVCYVLITCAEPSESGDMQVEMTYEGDAALACYLLQGAQNLIEEQEEFPLQQSNKVISISS